ncbi:autophagy protein Apg9-domain-containing protein [Neohortaea acidophila]|uniref:Autophagy-related protein 9 n=1 Tax=Neohortaea acidophila TaxID=245834 RepID=A0A6A6Q4B8_9PEZI|nr:autophagy protein Apg9-domain-containing protein [Neohortaea acidophila]KAF2487308.1 autophagy protein Apg9-domain-containing protein [Neohortaea acidophila]
MTNMMTSRVLSRFLPVAEGDVSVFETLRNEPHRHLDVESQRAPTSDGAFRDYDDDPEHMFFEGANDDVHLSPDARASMQSSPTLDRIRPKWLEDTRNRRIEEDEDVPDSLLLDPNTHPPSSRASSRPTKNLAQARVEAQWKAAQDQHGLHSTPTARQMISMAPRSTPDYAPPLQVDPQAQAMWMYTNANNLDAFLLEVYQYYVEHGVWSILLSRTISLLTELFVFTFAMFLTTCIDYSKIPSSKSTAEVTIPKCMSQASWLKNAALFFFVMYWLSRLVQFASSTRRLFHMHNFFLHVLGISDQDMQTVSWVRVVEGLVKVQHANIATADPPPKVREFLKYNQPQQRINAESVANRLMRKDNYYVAMYNKDIFDFTLPLPFVGSRQFYSKSLEWCIDFCLTNFIFDEQGSIRPFCLDVKNRRVLIDALRRRLHFAALTSVLIAPFNILRFCILYFFRYYTEFTKNYSRISARSFTPFAEWKIREFNELEHLFQRRLRQAYPFANDYLKQFPKDKTDQACRFVALVSGAIAAVLTLLSLWDPELFLGFEVTPGRTAFFWLTIMIGVFTAANGALPDENEVHDPVLHLKEVLMFTHYMPAHWKNRLHSNEVRAEFSAMYQMKVLIFVEEILSLIVAPWILLRNATTRCERIIDFFREQTVHVNGIGYQCNFAVFGFKKDLNAEDPTAVLNEPDGLRDDYYGLKDDKMAASVQNFMQYYSHFSHRQGVRRPQGWHPPPAWPPMLAAEDAGEDPQGGKVGERSTIQHTGSDRKHGARAAERTAPSTMRSPTRQRGAGGSAGKGMTESRLMAQDSELDDFAKDAGPDRFDSDPDEGADEGNITDRNAGVLGMLYQFSKAQTEKGTGINI